MWSGDIIRFKMPQIKIKQLIYLDVYLINTHVS